MKCLEDIKTSSRADARELVLLYKNKELGVRIYTNNYSQKQTLTNSL